MNMIILGLFFKTTLAIPQFKYGFLQMGLTNVLTGCSQNFTSKLKRHLHLRILASVSKSGQSQLPRDGSGANADAEFDPNTIVFRQDRMYRHNITRINYTTYDVQRSQDVINPSTSHCNIMVLASGDSPSDHKFGYARVLGIYHANVVYTGHGMINFEPRRMEFLWVRWYKGVELSNDWGSRKLDSIHFPAITDDSSFGFVDPCDVLRGCHIIPSFARGQVHENDKGLSRCARDTSDWKKYWVNR
jgi:hypothetical protein